MSDISEQVLRAAEAIIAAPAAQLAASFREALQKFVSSDFGIASAAVVDGTGRMTPRYSAVIYWKGAKQATEYPEGIPADRVAVVVEVYDELSPDRLREAYARIAEVKRLTKTPVPKGETRTNITLGIVFASKSVVSLDLLADQLYRIDLATPHKQWLDMLVVASVGVINYAVQFPGEGLAGDFMPPAEGALESPAPPAFYVSIVMRPTGVGSFNKLVAFIVGHLILFVPDVAQKQLNWNSILDGQTTGAITTLGFQPNLQGQLVAVPPEGYSGKFIPNRPVQIEDPQGEVLGAMQFMRWQTGGVILMAGKLPLEGMLLFLPNLKPEYLRVVKRPTHQISPILPISQLEFNQLLSNIQQRTNLRVREETGGIVMEKFLDEGTTTPFIARCTLSLLRIRENVLTDPKRRDDFDKRFESALSSIMTARKTSKSLLETWTSHRDRVASGQAARLEGRDIRVLESINKQLSDEFESLLNAATRAIKTGVQGLCMFLGVDIGFLFKKQSAFETGIERLRRTDAPLADYLVEVRRWTERLVLLRNNMEHDIWQFPKVVYSASNGSLRVTEPEVSGDRVTVLVEFLLDRILCFFEEMITHILQRHLPVGSTITEIARNLRAPEAPERFRITLDRGGEPPWNITYHTSRFDDT